MKDNKKERTTTTKKKKYQKPQIIRIVIITVSIKQ